MVGELDYSGGERRVLGGGACKAVLLFHYFNQGWVLWTPVHKTGNASHYFSTETQGISNTQQPNKTTILKILLGAKISISFLVHNIAIRKEVVQLNQSIITLQTPLQSLLH